YKTQIVIGFIVSLRLICLELICTLKISGGEYNLKDSGLIHALEPCPISSFSFRDYAISKAIGEVFNDSHLGNLNGNVDFHALFLKCMQGCESEIELKSTWENDK
ncbi:hypothetical protein Gotur_015020, partial [Gossypium turneri]